MRRINFLNVGDTAQAENLGLDAVKVLRRDKLLHPGIVLRARHIVVRVIACDNHHRTKRDLLKARLLDRFDYSIDRSLRRLAFDGADEHVIVAELPHCGLHLGIGDCRGVGGTVSQEDKGRAVLSCLLDRIKTAVGHSCLDKQGRDLLLVGIDLLRILAHFAEQRLCERDFCEIRLVFVERLL